MRNEKMLETTLSLSKRKEHFPDNQEDNFYKLTMRVSEANRAPIVFLMQFYSHQLI